MPEENFIILKIEGEFLDIMCEVNPEQRKNVRMENGVKVIYLRLLKAYMATWSPRYYGMNYMQKILNLRG